MASLQQSQPQQHTANPQQPIDINNSRDENAACSSTNTTLSSESPHVAYMRPKILSIIEKADSKPVDDCDSVTVDYPTIDISSFVTPNLFTKEERDTVIDQVIQAAKCDAGSFHITGHGIPLQLIHDLEHETASFFHKPMTTKQQYVDVPFRRGYTGMDTTKVMKFHGKAGVSLREMFAIEDLGHVTCPEPLRTYLVKYVNHQQRVELLIRHILTLALARVKQVTIPDGTLSEVNGKQVHNFRSFFYPNNPQSQPFASQDRLQPHTDVSAVTLLYCRSEGLEEIRNGRWTKVPPNTPETLRVHLGDLFEFMSNGLFNSCIHRVNPTAAIAATTGAGSSSDGGATGNRYSYGYFRFSKAHEDNTSDDRLLLHPILSAGEQPKFPPVVSAEYFVAASKAYFTTG